MLKDIQLPKTKPADEQSPRKVIALKPYRQVKGDDVVPPLLAQRVLGSVDPRDGSFSLSARLYPVY